MAVVTYSESIGYTFVNFIVLAVSAVFHVLFVWLFVYEFQWGWEGVLYATSFHFVVRFLVSHVYLCFVVKPYTETPLDFWTKESFTALWP